ADLQPVLTVPEQSGQRVDGDALRIEGAVEAPGLAGPQLGEALPPSPCFACWGKGERTASCRLEPIRHAGRGPGLDPTTGIEVGQDQNRTIAEDEVVVLPTARLLHAADDPARRDERPAVAVHDAAKHRAVVDHVHAGRDPIADRLVKKLAEPEQPLRADPNPHERDRDEAADQKPDRTWAHGASESPDDGGVDGRQVLRRARRRGNRNLPEVSYRIATMNKRGNRSSALPSRRSG